MMLKEQNTILESFLTNQTLDPYIFFEMLTIRDFLSLLHLNRNIRHCLKQRKTMVNQLYHLFRLTIDKSLYYDFYYDEDIRKKDEGKVQAACSTSPETFW